MRRFFYLGVLILIGFGLRVHLLGSQELRGDEGFTWNYVQKPPLDIVATIVREGDPQPPLHYWLQWGWLQLTGDSEFAMRAWSAFLSLLLVPLTYRFARRFWLTEVGLLAGGLTAIHPQQIWLAQDVRNMYQLALVFLLLAALQLPFRTASRRWPPRAWIGYVLCGAAAMYSHYYAVFVLVAQGAYFLPLTDDPGQRWSDIRRWAAAGLVIGSLVAPWAVVILPVYAAGQLADPGHLDIRQYAFSSFGDLLAGPAQSDLVKTGVILAAGALLIAALAALGSAGPARPRSALLPFLTTGLLIPFIGIYAVTATRATFNTFYFSFAFPAAYVVVAGAAYFLWTKAAWAGLGVSGAVCLALGSGLFNHYNDPDFTKTRGFREIATYLAAHAEPGDLYLANAPDPAQVYYLRRLAIDYRMQPGRIGLGPAQIDADLRLLVVHRIWFVPVNSALDPAQHVAQRLGQWALLADDQVHYRTKMQLYLPANAAEPLAAEFADGISLVGYYYTSNRLSLVWRAESRPAADYTVFVHALAADTFNITGHDSPPDPPTSQWVPGQLVVDVHEFSVPTDQPVTLVAGMYLPTAGPRLSLTTESWGEPEATKVITLNP